MRYINISIHALLAESDCPMLKNSASVTLFLSTLSLRRATKPRSIQGLALRISIHALLAESDFHLFASSGVDFAISIHALLAESDTWARGSRVTYVISIHALLAESDAAGRFPVILII